VIGNGKVEVVKDDDKINLPRGQSPVQVLASFDKDGKLVIKQVVTTWRAVPLPPGPGGPGGVPGPGGPGAPGGPAVAPAIAKVEQVTAIQTQTFDLEKDKIEVYDTKGKAVDLKEVKKMLKEETPAMAMHGSDKKFDPMHTRLLKEGTLTFVLPGGPMFRGGGGFGIGGPGIQLPPNPVPPPGPGAPGRPGAVPGGTGTAVPGTTTAPVPK
jgi:hypothetical protein